MGKVSSHREGLGCDPPQWWLPVLRVCPSSNADKVHGGLGPHSGCVRCVCVRHRVLTRPYPAKLISVPSTGRINTLFHALDNPINDDDVNFKMKAVWEGLKAVNPAFASMSHGHYEQQDAIEAWNQLVNTVKSAVPDVPPPPPSLLSLAHSDVS